MTFCTLEAKRCHSFLTQGSKKPMSHTPVYISWMRGSSCNSLKTWSKIEKALLILFITNSVSFHIKAFHTGYKLEEEEEDLVEISRYPNRGKKVKN